MEMHLVPNQSYRFARGLHAGDHRVIQQIYDHFYPFVQRRCRSVSWRFEALHAPDLFQETLEWMADLVSEEMSVFVKEATFSKRFYTNFGNNFTNRLRKHLLRRPGNSEPLEETLEYLRRADSDPDPHDQCQFRDLEALIERLICTKQDPDDQKLLRLYFFENPLPKWCSDQLGRTCYARDKQMIFRFRRKVLLPALPPEWREGF